MRTAVNAVRLRTCALLVLSMLMPGLVLAQSELPSDPPVADSAPAPEAAPPAPEQSVAPEQPKADETSTVEAKPDEAKPDEAKAVEPVHVTASELGVMDVCKEMQDEAALTTLERVRRRLSIAACASSGWLDSLFGDQLRYEEYHETYGSVSVGTLWSDYEGLDPRLRFRIHLKLPQWDERISAFAGRVGEENYISDVEDDFDALPTRQFGNLEDESVLLGLGYSNPKRTGNDFDASIGVRLDFPVDPYVRTRYEIVRNFAEQYVFSARETLFWQNSEGLGTTTRLTLDRAMSERFLLRWSNLGTFTQETDGLEWYSQLTLFQSVGERVGLAWQAQVEGATDNEVPLTQMAVRLIMRRQFRNPDWLFLELRGGVGWPREKLEEARKVSPEFGVAFEMQFGDRKKRKRF
ncbi:MAG: hypothetical protein ACJ8MR_14695 [Povalibacter sp.]